MAEDHREGELCLLKLKDLKKTILISRKESCTIQNRVVSQQQHLELDSVLDTSKE